MQQTQILHDELSQLDFLKDAGFAEEQARAVVRVAMSIKTEHLATKDQLTKAEAAIGRITDIVATKKDIADVQTELKTDIANTHAKIEAVRTELKEDIRKLESRLTTRILSILGLQTTFMMLILALLRFWH